MKRFSLAAALLAVLIFSATPAPAGESSATFISTNVFNPDPAVPLFRVARKGPLVHTAQFYPMAGESLEKQVKSILDEMARTLNSVDYMNELENIVKLNVYAPSADIMAEVKKILLKRSKLRSNKLPAMTFVTGALPRKDISVAMDAVAVTRGKFPELTRFPNATVLPADGVVFISGQADKSELIEATGKTLEKLEESLKFLNLDKTKVVQCKAFLQPMERVEEVRAVFQKFFGPDCPPLVFVDWRSKDPVIEIEMIAASKPSGNGQMEFLTQPGITPSPVYAKIVKVNAGKLIYISGLYGRTTTNANAEVTEILSNLGEIAKFAGSDMTHLAKATYYVSNNETSNELNKLRPKYYDPKRPPAASKAMVPGVGMSDRGITLDMIAVTVEK